MTIKIGINGMGRIGRMVVRSIIESKNKNFVISHINNRSSAEATVNLIKYDSIHGRFIADLKFDKTAGTATVVVAKGCVARCTFCHRFEKGYRVSPTESIIEHMRMLRDKYVF